MGLDRLLVALNGGMHNMENKLGIYAICRDEIKFVDQWVENVLPADYIAVLDTGSQDGTWERLQEEEIS